MRASILKKWNQYWFLPKSAFNLAVGRIIFFLCILVYYDDIYLFHSLGAWANVSNELWEPISLFKYIPFLPIQSQLFINIISSIWGVSVLFCVLGLFTSISTVICSVLMYFVLGYPNCFGKINHADHPVVLITFILAASRCGELLSIDSYRKKKRSNANSISWEYGWPIRLIHVSLSIFYLSSGYQKLSTSGFDWFTSDNLANIVLKFEQPFGMWVLNHFPMSLNFVAGMVFFSELFAPLSLINSKFALIIIPILFTFHAATPLVLGKAGSFYPWLFCFLWWIPFDRVFLLIRRAQIYMKHL